MSQSILSRLSSFFTGFTGSPEKPLDFSDDETLPDPENGLYPLSSDRLKTLTLPSGRQIEYAQYGSPTGTPLIYLHGSPATCIEGAGLHPTALSLNARIIAITRPSLGRSSPSPNRTILSHATDDVLAVADYLHIASFGVLGISGGGPYALGCAKALPKERLKAVGIVCGLGPPDMGYWGMHWFNYIGWTFAGHYFMGPTCWWFSREAANRLDLSRAERWERVRAEFEKGRAGMEETEAGVLCDPDWQRMHLRRAEEVWRQGDGGWRQDFRVLNNDWGFGVEEVRRDLRVDVWHGRLDGNVPVHHGRGVVERLNGGGGEGGGRARLWETADTHASIWAEEKKTYLKRLVEQVKAQEEEDRAQGR